MAKDPAFLFYYGDALKDIMLMTLQQKGYYLTIICSSHVNMCLSYDELMIIMQGSNELDLKVIMSKIESDEQENYFIPWVKEAQEKRAKYSESRRNNRKKGLEDKKEEKISSSYDDHMANAIENGDKSKDEPEEVKDKDNGQPEIKYGKPDINELIKFLKDANDGKSLDGTVKYNRRFCNLLINKIAKDYPELNPVESIKIIITKGKNHKFHGPKITGFHYLYYNTTKLINEIKTEQNGNRKNNDPKSPDFWNRINAELQRRKDQNL